MPLTPPHWALYRRLSQQVELQQHGLGLLEERLQGSEAQQIAQALSSSEGHLGEAEQALQAARDKQQQMMAAARQLEKDIASFGKERDKLIKAATGRVAAAKAGVEAARKELKAKEAQLQVASWPGALLWTPYPGRLAWEAT